MAGALKLFDPKDPEEVVTLTFDFADELGAETINPGPAVAVAVKKGADPDVAQVANGAPQVSGATVLQSVKAGVAGVDYAVRCKATTSGGRVLVIARVLPIRNAV
jgi:hypothetical protein